MDPKHEFARLRGAMQRKEATKLNVDVATVVDASDKNALGYVTAQKADGTPLNVHAWTTELIPEGSQIYVQRVVGGGDNWWVCIGVNATTDPENTPYVQPTLDPEALPVHDLAGDRHAGTLPWEMVSTENAKVELQTQTNGYLPKNRQEPQCSRQQLSFGATVAPGATATGQLACPRFGWVRRILVTGGELMVLTLYEETDVVEYQTVSTTTPYQDYRGYCHASNEAVLRWSLHNTGSGSGTFTVTLDVVAWI